MGLPDLLGRFNDEGGRVFVEFVGMRGKPAMLGFFKAKGEGVKGLFGSQPHKAAAARVDVWLKAGGIAGADAAVQAIARDHQICAILLRQRLIVLHIRLKDQLHAQLLATVLQDIEQMLSANAAKAVACGAHAAALEEDLDIVPMIEGIANELGARGISGAQILQGLIGEHHPPAKRIKGPIALHHDQTHVREAAFHQQGEIQATGPATDAQDGQRGKRGCCIHFK